MSKPLTWIGLAKTCYNVLGCGRHGRRKTQAALNDLFVDAHRVLIPERGLPGQKLVDEDPESPPVHCEAMPAVVDHLGSEVLWGAA